MELLSLPEAAKRVGVSHSTLRWQVKNGALKADWIAGRWLVTMDEADRYARENKGMNGNRRKPPTSPGGSQ